MPKQHIHRHADWTDGTGPVVGASSSTRGRKMDTNKRWYPTEFWVKQAERFLVQPLWDGHTPPVEELRRASETPGDVSLASYRLACRLHDLGYYAGVVQPRGEQGYPVKAVQRVQRDMNAQETGLWGPRLHQKVWGD
jgi:hypothetical protein